MFCNLVFDAVGEQKSRAAHNEHDVACECDFFLKNRQKFFFSVTCMFVEHDLYSTHSHSYTPTHTHTHT